MSKAGIMSYIVKASYSIKSRLSRMALLVAFCLGGGTVVRGQELPDELTVNIGPVENVGEDVTLVLQKRSVRSENYALFINENGTRRRAKPFPVTTYRGHVDGDPTMRVNGNIEPGNLLSANFSEGRDIIAHVTQLEIAFKPGKSTPFSSSGNKVVPMSSLTPRESPTKGGYVVPPLPMRLVRMKLNVAPELFANSKISVETAVSRAEQKMNDADFNWARNVATAWEIEELEIGSPDPVRGVQWYTPAEGEPAWQSRAAFGATFVASGNYIRGGHPFVAGLGQEAGGFMHEAGHAFGCPHGLDVRDAMHGNRAWFGPNNTRVIVTNWRNRPEERFPAVIYNGDLPPQAQDDVAETRQDKPLVIDVLDNDFDGNGNALSLRAVGPAQEGGVTALTEDSMKVLYTPPSGFVGLDSFKYEVVDSAGNASRAATVRVNVIPKDGILAYFDFEEFQLVQASGHGSPGYEYKNLGPVGGNARSLFFKAESVPGVGGGNALFNGINSGWGANRNPRGWFHQINIPGIGDPGPGSLSVSMWIMYPKLRQNMQPPHRRNVASTSGVIIGKGAIKFTGDPNQKHAGWAIIHLPKYEGFKFMGSSADAAFDLQTMEQIRPNAWYHLAMSIDRENGRLRAWVNNNEVTETTTTHEILPGNIFDAQELRLFNGHIWQYWHSFPAVVDELKLFGVPLTSARVAELYAEGKDSPVPDLAHLRHDEKPEEPVEEDSRWAPAKSRSIE